MSILRYEENGIEFFTVQATGESGISYSGLAILCGVNQSTITKLISKLSDLTLFQNKEQTQLDSNSSNSFNPMQTKILKRLQAFRGKDLHLEGDYKKQGGAVKILRADFCAAVIKHYALEGREIAEHSMDKFITLGMNTWIQSITGWQIEATPTDFKTSVTPNQQPVNQNKNLKIEQLKKQLDRLQQDLTVALKHRHAIHNVVEKPTVVDLSLNQIIHTAVHVQAEKLNQAITTVQSLRENVIVLETINNQIQKYDNLWQSFNQVTKIVEELRQENKDLNKVIQQQKIFLSSRRKAKAQLQAISTKNLNTILQPRIKEITAILMQYQKRTGGNRAINTCTKKANIYARYEVGQSLAEIASALNLPYETVKTYVKTTRADIKRYFDTQKQKESKRLSEKFNLLHKSPLNPPTLGDF